MKWLASAIMMPVEGSSDIQHETHCRRSVKLCVVIINRKDQISMSGVNDIVRSRGAQIPGPRTVRTECFADRCMPKF